MVQNNDIANETTFNNSFMSREVDTSTIGRIDQANTTQSTDKDTGAFVTEGGLGVEKNINAGGTIKNADITESTDKDTGAIVTEGGAGIEKNLNVGGNINSVGTVTGSNLSGTNSGDIALASIGAVPNSAGASLTGQLLNLQPASSSFGGVVTTGAQNFAGNKTFDNDVVIDGDLTVNGTTTTVNSATLDVTDANVTVNVGGNDATANGAGLTVDRTGTSGSFVYDETLTSKWKAGDLGSESEVLDVDSNQIINGIKTFDNKIELEKKLLGQQTVDSSTTGANASVDALTLNLKVINVGLTSIRDILNPEGTQTFVLTNGTGNSIDIINDNAAATRIQTGTGADITLEDGASLVIQYDNDDSLWRVIGGSGGGAGFTLAAIGASPNANGATYLSGTFNLEPASASFGGVVTTGTQSFAGNKTFTGSIGASNLSGTNTGDVTLSAIGASPNANGATLTGQVINLEPASASFGGVLTAGTQDIAGVKTFKASVTHEVDAKFKSDNANLVTVKAPTGLAASYDLTLPPNDGSTDQFLKTDGSGVTSWQTITQEINYIENDGAEINTSGWVAFLDAATSRPTDGTGGSPSGNFALTRTTSSVLRGNASFRINNVGGASNRGEGYSYDFTIDSADQAKLLQISFDYMLTSSGGFQVGTSTQDSDVIVYIYDITNAALIEPSYFKLDCGVLDVKLRFEATFQTAYNSTSYRLILYKGTTTTTGFNFNFDNVRISPMQFTGSRTDNVGKFYRNANQTGINPNNSFVKITLNTVLFASDGGFDSANSRYIAQTSGKFQVNGNIFLQGTNVLANLYVLIVYKNGVAQSYGTGFFATAAGQFSLNVSDVIDLVAGDYLELFFYGQGNNSVSTLTATGGSTLTFLSVAKVSSAGAASGVNASIGTEVTKTANQAITTGGVLEKVTFNTAVVDKNAAFDDANDRIIIKESGDYLLMGSIGFQNTTAEQEQWAQIRINGSTIGVESINTKPANVTNGYNTVHCYTLRALKATDYVELWARTTLTGLNIAGSSSFGATRLVAYRIGSSQDSISNEKIGLQINNQLGSATLNATPSVVTFSTVTNDTHGGYNTSTGLYTVRKSDWYTLSGKVDITHASVAVNSYVAVSFIINGSSGNENFNTAGNTANTTMTVSTSASRYLLAGTTVGLGARSNGTTPTLSTGLSGSFFTISN